MSHRFPGLIEARLGRIDETTWVDVWVWESMDRARAAADGAFEVPEAARWFAHIDKVLGMEHATVAHETASAIATP